MKLIGRSVGGRSFMVLVSQDGRAEDARAAILDLDQRRLFPEMLLQSILARGYWEEYEGGPGELEELLSQVERVTKHGGRTDATGGHHGPGGYHGHNPSGGELPIPDLSFARVSGERFVATRARAPERYQPFLTPHPAEEIDEMQAFLGPEGSVGFAVAPDGEIVNLFTLEDSPPRWGKAAMVAAIARGGRWTSNFSGFLERYYEQFGFETSERLQWDDQFAPGGWDYEALDRPDVVEMRLLRSEREGRAGVVKSALLLREEYEAWVLERYGSEWVNRNSGLLDLQWEFLSNGFLDPEDED